MILAFWWLPIWAVFMVVGLLSGDVSFTITALFIAVLGMGVNLIRFISSFR